jgi:hypothetical protein
VVAASGLKLQICETKFCFASTSQIVLLQLFGMLLLLQRLEMFLSCQFVPVSQIDEQEDIQTLASLGLLTETP